MKYFCKRRSTLSLFRFCGEKSETRLDLGLAYLIKGLVVNDFIRLTRRFSNVE